MFRQNRVLFAAWLLMAALHIGASVRTLDTPGLFYDEAIQAAPSLDFLRGQMRALHPPGLETIPVLGRPFPWMTQPYMGALKSQLLIPGFALFEPGPAVLRITTELWALVGVLFAMLWANLVLGRTAALASGALLLADPTLLFATRHDWGSAALALLCRCAGLYFATLGWRTRRPLHAGLAGLAFGIGLYNKIDFAAFLGAAAIALVIARADVVSLARRRRELGWGALAFAIGAAPMVLSMPQLIRVTSQVAARGPFMERLQVAWSTLDGSYFFRLWTTGGRYERLFELPDAPMSLLGYAVLGSLLLLAAVAWRAPRCLPSPRTLVFVVVGGVLTQLALLAMPGAQRVHHMMNVCPFSHLLVASALVALSRLRPPRIPGFALRASAATVFVTILVSNVWMTARIFQLLEASGGRGYWSDSLERFAEEVERQPEVTVVSLDWGFHPPLMVLTESPRLLEPFWYLRPDREWLHRGDANHIYLVHEPPYDRFGHGLDFLEQAAELPAGAVETRAYRDREGDVAFLAIRLHQPHRLFFRDRLRISLP